MEKLKAKHLVGNLTEAEAIKQAKEGEAAAFEFLYKAHCRRVYSLCLRMIKNPAEAEDLTQQAFLQLFRKISTFRGESGFSTWLHRVTVNIVLMHLRRKKTAEILVEDLERHGSNGEGPFEHGSSDTSMLGAILPVLSKCSRVQELPGRDQDRYREVGLDEDLALVPTSGISEEFRELSRFMQVIVLVPKSAVHEKTTQKKPGPNKSATSLIDTSDVCLPLDAAKAWSRNPNATDMFEFGEVKGCFSAMEIHRNGRPVILTCKEFKMLAYLIKNPRRVISRDELLNEVWGYENYPCTRTVDNHILKLRKKLETEPTRPKHFHTVHSSGYKFLP